MRVRVAMWLKRRVMEEAFESAIGAMSVIKKTKCDLPRVERAA